MMKKTVAIILTVVLLVCLAPIVELSGTGRVNSSDAFKITAKAAEIIDSGSCGDAVNYTFSSDGVLSIYGSGDMTKNNHSSEGFPWSEYRDEIQSVIIDDGVTSIGNYAFFHCSSLTSVTIPEGITSIGQAAFQDCRALPSILLPGSLTEIKQQAFYFCNQLTSIRIPSNVNKIDYSAFQFCFQLSEISFPENLLYLGDKVFDSTPWYNNQPDGIIYIGKCLYTYKGTMPENTTIEVEPGIMYIAAKAFEGRTELTNIVLPDSITTISTYAFYGCTGLTEIDIPEQVEVLSQNLFGGCIGLTDITIPGGITQIDNYVFNGCSNLEAIHFCGSECQWDKIIIAATNTEILQSVSISFVGAHVPGTPVETVITPADEEHEGEKRVTVICTVCGETVSETTEPIPATGTTAIIASGECGDSSFGGIASWTLYDSGLLYIRGTGWTKNYNAGGAAPWYAYRNRITSLDIDVTHIGGYSFCDCSELRTVTFGNNVRTISWNAFQNCTGLTELYIPDNVDSLATYAFSGCTNLKFVRFSKNIITIPAYCFQNCISLETISWYSGLKNIENGAFQYCSALSAIDIPNGVTKIGSNAFSGCTSLSDISVPNGMQYIGQSAFSNTAWYNSQPNGVVYLGHYLVAYKGSMAANTHITVQDGTELILPYAFFNFSTLSGVNLPSSITGIGNAAFYYCNNLNEVHYTGSRCQWERIEISSSNENLTRNEIAFISEHISGVPTETIIKEATENEEGEKRVTVICTVCGETVSETTEPIPATGATDDPGEDPGSDTGYLAGDIIEFGSYPQTRVTDESLIAELDAAATDVEWQSLGYEVLDQEPFAFYKDIELNGVRYRAQRYTAYRSDHSGSQGESTYSCPQYINGYQINTTFWFRYDPIQWKVLDPKTGLLFPEMILDAQAINRVAYNEAGEPHTGVSAAGYDYADAAHQYYLNNYAHSDVRTWLLDIFTQTAFTEQERTILQPVELDNSVSETENESFMQYGCENTVDAVFLLSYGESAEEAYFADNAARCRAGTDYAKAQGLYHYSSGSDYEYWYLRSPGSVAVYHGYIYDDGVISAGCEAVGTDIGICPGVVISLDAYDALNAEEPDTPEEPDEPTPSPYDDFTFTYAERILTVSGRGTLPTVTSLAETPLAPFAEECHVLVLENGEKTVQSSAFAGFESLSMLIVNSPATIEAGAFADNNGLQTVICADTVEIIDNPFASDAGLRFYEPKDTPHTGTLPVNCTTLPYFFSDGTLSIEGSVEMDSYDLLDLMAVMCSKYDDIRYVKFDSYTSLDIPFYVFDDGTGEYEPVENNTLNGVSFSISAYGETNWETISFNEFCERSQDGSLGTFYLVAQTEKGEEVQDTSIRILDQIRESIKRALKWIVSLLNYLFDILNKFGK